MSDKIKALDKQIVSEILLENRAHKTLWTLCDLGTRFAGSPGERLAGDFISEALKSYGLDPKREPFEHLGWERGTAALEVIAPVRRQLQTISLAGGPSTPEGGITGTVLPLGHGSPVEFEAKKRSIKDRIVLSTSLSPRAACSPPRQCHRRTKYGRAVAFGAKAFIFMNSKAGMLHQTGSLRQNREGEIPAVTVPFEEGELLKRFAVQGDMTIHLEVYNKNFVNKTANIVAELPGKDPNRIILVGAHYDCHDDSPGALDNGTGVTTLLELARILAESGVELEKTIRFVFFGVEELATVGSSFYVLEHKDELEKIELMINLDSPGAKGGKTFDTGGFEEVDTFLSSVSKDMEYPMEESRPSFGADQLPFFLRGVPSISMKKASSPGMFSYPERIESEDRGWSHTPADTPDKITPAQINEGAIVAGRVLIRAADCRELIAEHRTAEQVGQLLDGYGMDEVLHYMKYPSIPYWPW